MFFFLEVTQTEEAWVRGTKPQTTETLDEVFRDGNGRDGKEE